MDLPMTIAAETSEKRRAASAEMNRIEAFSDGVFGIALTLLVLELKVPHPEEIASGADLARALVAHWSSYLGFLRASPRSSSCG